ncbi:pentapeptide repeat-containing protein [Nocardia yamanashiensis]|uniref:pentapeptide repeat-containing protein n=1 Tax=Nocardia yamanashiensis TaxID=209247 RepID=UPI0038CD1E2B
MWDSNPHLAKASFRGSNLAGAILGQGDLGGADFTETDLSKPFIDPATVLEGADFSGANLTKSRGAR